MFKYNCLNPISPKGLEGFSNAYVPSDISHADAILVRSAQMHEMKFEKELKAIARAGVGVNNIPLRECAEQGIVVFNTPGANANGVKELVIAGMLLAARDILGGIRWVREMKDDGRIGQLTEKKKNEFAGREIEGKKLGVIGLGSVGILVANAAVQLGMEVYGYDPYISVESAWKLSKEIHHAETVEELYRECDYITIHVPAIEATKEMINREALEMMKEGAVVLNFARDILVEEEAIIDSLRSGHIKRYVTDFPTPEIANEERAIVIPHLGASTEEAEDNCAEMAVMELRDFLENGNIRNSVNYPNCDMGYRGECTRITILHKNKPNMIGQFAAVLAEDNMNIADMANKSRGEYAYTIIDIDSEMLRNFEEDIKRIDGVLRIRVIA